MKCCLSCHIDEKCAFFTHYTLITENIPMRIVNSNFKCAIKGSIILKKCAGVIISTGPEWGKNILVGLKGHSYFFKAISTDIFQSADRGNDATCPALRH